jgi:hypothetical protein
VASQIATGISREFLACLLQVVAIDGGVKLSNANVDQLRTGPTCPEVVAESISATRGYPATISDLKGVDFRIGYALHPWQPSSIMHNDVSFKPHRNKTVRPLV